MDRFFYLGVFFFQGAVVVIPSSKGQKQPSRGVLRKRCSENNKEIYRGVPMPKRDFNKVLQSNFIEITHRHGCSPVNLLHVFRISFPKNTSGRLLLKD